VRRDEQHVASAGALTTQIDTDVAFAPRRLSTTKATTEIPAEVLGRHAREQIDRPARGLVAMMRTVWWARAAARSASGRAHAGYETIRKARLHPGNYLSRV